MVERLEDWAVGEVSKNDAWNAAELATREAFTSVPTRKVANQEAATGTTKSKKMPVQRRSRIK